MSEGSPRSYAAGLHIRKVVLALLVASLVGVGSLHRMNKGSNNLAAALLPPPACTALPAVVAYRPSVWEEW
jgi:hypothetical protein